MKRLAKLRQFLAQARRRARFAESEVAFLRKCLLRQTEEHQREREELKRDLAQSRAFTSVINGRLARIGWQGPVKSPIDGKIYNTPASYAAHLALHNKVIN